MATSGSGETAFIAEDIVSFILKNIMYTKSVLEQGIVGHVSRFPDRFQLVGVDCKRVEFNLLRGVRGVKGVALDVSTAAATAAEFQKQMMSRLFHKMSLRVE